MRRMIYCSLARFPTEKAHGLQIAQNCEAFAEAGYAVELWVSRRFNTRAMRAITDPYAHYGIQPNFRIRRIPGVDLYPLMGGSVRLERIAFYIHALSYIIMLLLRLPFSPAEVYYSRDELLLLALSYVLPAHKLAYEVHLFAPSRGGAWLQSRVLARVGSVIAITPRLAHDLAQKRSANPQSLIVAHDGVRAARFADLPTREAARAALGWPEERFIVGFVGRLQMIQMDKGVSTLIEAIAALPQPVSLALVGGPDEMAQALRHQWSALGLPPQDFRYLGQVPPDEVPRCLCAFDLCAMPHPFTQQFAYYTSPLKLFEYMASGRAIVASDLPGWADVLRHEENALLCPPGDAAALAQAIQRLYEDPPLRESLAQAAQAQVFARHTWAARAEQIRRHIERFQPL